MATWLTPEDLSKMTGISTKRLANLRSERRQFPFYRLEGSRAPVYKKEEIDRLLEANRVEVRP